MNASEVIKIVSEIVPGASASVEANPENPSTKVFLIKGIRERKRTHLRSTPARCRIGPVLTCLWLFDPPPVSLPWPAFPTEPEPNPLLTATFQRLHARIGPQTQAAEGNALTCALTLRNLSRAVIDLLDLHDGDDDDGGSVGGEVGNGVAGEKHAGDEGRQGRRKRAKLQNGELFGLPIPESLKYAGQGQNAPTAGSGAGESGNGDEGVDGSGAQAADDVRLSAAEAARVRSAFSSASVEESVLEWVTEEDKLAPYLTEVGPLLALRPRVSALIDSRPLSLLPSAFRPAQVLDCITLLGRLP
jgi:hypothetical protein